MTTATDPSISSVTFTKRQTSPFHRIVLAGVAFAAAFALAASGSASAQTVWQSVSAGGGHHCGIVQGGEAHCWGQNGDGQTNLPSLNTGEHWTSISAGWAHTCGVTSEGRGLCWGFDGGYQTLAVPTLADGETWASLTAGNTYSCGVTTSGAGQCWGNAGNGGITTLPTLADGVTWAAISAGGEMACGVTSAGQGHCWGASGEVSLPVSIEGKTWTSIVAGPLSACGVTDTGEGHCWSSDGTELTTVPSLADGVTWASIGLGGYGYGVETFCGVKSNHEGVCWGDDTFGQASETNQSSGEGWQFSDPRQSAIATGTYDSCGITTVGRLVCWGLHGPTYAPDFDAPAAPHDFTGVPSGTSNADSVTIGFTLSEPWSYYGGTVECRVDNGSWNYCTPANFGDTTSSFTASGLSDGQHTISVRQTDAAGNVGTVATTSQWTTDTTRPDTPYAFTGVPSGSLPLTRVNIGFTLGESGGKVECSLDRVYAGGAESWDLWRPCSTITGTSGSFRSSGLTGAAYFMLGVRQTDAAGNTSFVGGVTFGAGSNGWANVSAGHEVSCGAFQDGRGRCWGSASNGQTTLPALDSGDRWASISTGYSHTCGLSILGAGLCWGSNMYGGTSLPTLATGVSWKSISASRWYSCGVTSEGQGLCWGTGPTTLPTLSGGATWVSISSGPDHACGVTSDGQGICWGENTSGETNVPTLPAGTTWESISAGLNHSCGVTGDGQALCWGSNVNGNVNVPSLDAGDSWVSVSAGSASTCGVTTNGLGLCWGSNSEGRTDVPTLASGVTWDSISVGDTHACGITSAGDAICWGANNAAQLDVPDMVAPRAPSVQVDDPTGPASKQNTASISFTLGEEVSGGSVECRLDDGSWQDCTSSVTGTSGSYSLTGLSEGAHTFSVRQTDASGNVSAVGTSPEWAVDNTAPAAPVLSNIPAQTRSTTVSVGISGESGASFSCKLDNGSYAPCTWGTTFRGLSEGTHTIYAKQTDYAGNEGPEASISWIVNLAPLAAPGLSGAPASPTRSATASISITGEAGASFRCKLDSGAYSGCTSPRSLSSLAEGSHTFYATQTDSTGTVSAAASVTWVVDRTAPSAPVLSGGPAPHSNSTSASVGFSGEANATFSCRLDGGTFSACGSSPKALTGLAEGSHTLYVTQTDQAGNESAASTVSWVVDTSTPSAPGLSGAPAALSSSTSASIGFSGEANATFSCKLDAGAYSACGSSPKALSGLSDGSHTFYVTQTDQAGNVSAAASVSWTIDTTAPGAPGLSGGPASRTKSTSASIGFSGEANATFSCRLDGGAYSACGASPKALGGLSEGTHTLYVKQTDQAGNVGPAASLTWTIDTTAPSAPGLSGAPPSRTNSTSASIGFSGEANATFSCRLDAGVGGSFEPCGSSPTVLSGLSEGAHFLYVTQTDQAGNESAVSTVSWVVDTTAPSAPGLSGGPAAHTSSTSASIGFSGEVNATFTCRLDGGAYSACGSSPKVLSGLAEGSHTFYVKQTDQAGNASSVSSLAWEVDTTSPSAPGLSGAPTSPSSSTTASIGFTGEANASFSCKLDGDSYSACGSSPKSLTGLADGVHTFYVKQADQAGNESPAASVSWVVQTSTPTDTVAPARPGSFTGVPAGRSNSSSVTIGFALGEPINGGLVECQVDSGSWSDCSADVTGTSGSRFLTGLSDGPHTFSVRQTDAAGNVSAVGTTAAWAIDTVAPSAPTGFTGLPAAGGTTTATSATIGFAVGETGGTVECKVDSGAWGACTSVSSTSGTQVISGLTTGLHTFYVRQRDAVGNVSAVGRVSWTVVRVVAPSCPAPTLNGSPEAIFDRVTLQRGESVLGWRIAVSASANSDRNYCALLTIQISLQTSKPSDAPVTKPFKYSDGIYPFLGTVTRNGPKPRWIRVQNQVGTWSQWVPVR